MTTTASDLLKQNTPKGPVLEKPQDDIASNRKVDDQDPSKPAVDVENKDVDSTVGRAPLMLDVEGNEAHTQLEGRVNSQFPMEQDVIEEVKDLLEELDEERSGHYKYPRYFAQVNGAEGFTYLITSADGGTAPVVFDKGIFSTTEIIMIEQLTKDIKRPQGIGGYVREISANEYTKIVQSGKQYARLKGTKGTVHTGDMADAAQKENIQLRNEIEELKKKLAEKD